jgi:hypothetical protein
LQMGLFFTRDVRYVEGGRQFSVAEEEQRHATAWQNGP